MKKYSSHIKGKRILITGGTGSFGSTMARALIDLSPKEIIIFSRDELKQYEMRDKYVNTPLRFIIGDIRDRDSIEHAMEHVDYVFHAAALKQVPSCEFFPMEAIKTNVLGGYNVMQSAIAKGVQKVVVLSTDKAVYPINAMGMTKALMEKVMIATAKEVERQKAKTILCGVRYGNVMYSRGSVIPLFIKQMQEGKKLTITNARMTRFLLPLSESVRLVLHALSKGKNGSMYVKKAPAANMQILAEAVCELFNVDKDFRTIGTRAGEKMHETLVSAEEWVRVIDEGDFFQIPREAEFLDYDKYYSHGLKKQHEIEGYTSANTKQLTINQTKKLLKSLPEIHALIGKEKKNEKK